MCALCFSSQVMKSIFWNLLPLTSFVVRKKYIYPLLRYFRDCFYFSFGNWLARDLHLYSSTIELFKVKLHLRNLDFLWLYCPLIILPKASKYFICTFNSFKVSSSFNLVSFERNRFIWMNLFFVISFSFIFEVLNWKDTREWLPSHPRSFAVNHWHMLWMRDPTPFPCCPHRCLLPHPGTQIINSQPDTPFSPKRNLCPSQNEPPVQGS